MTVEIGDAIGQEVGSSVELFSVGGSDAHRAKLSAGLKAAGVEVENAPKGLKLDFAMGNAIGYSELNADNNRHAKIEAKNDATFALPARRV